jgi:RimJ/RimL family protein N-acetyltransferase
MPQLIGERIRLRAPAREDIDLFLKWVNDPDVTEDLMLVYPLSFAEEEQWYENMLKTPPASHPMVIEVRDDDFEGGYRPIGDCQFHNLDWRCRSAEIGIMIGEKAYWNQGYGTETLKRVLRHGFESLNLHRIWLRVYAKNKRGIRAYEKAGFVYEGMLRQAHYQHGRYFDVHLMSVLRGEWENSEPEEHN